MDFAEFKDQFVGRLLSLRLKRDAIYWDADNMVLGYRPYHLLQSCIFGKFSFSAIDKSEKEKNKADSKRLKCADLHIPLRTGR